MEGNPTLRTMYQKARDASVPMETIERAIKRGTGELEGVRYEPVTYEGYAPCGVAVIVECLTDNRNRTGADIRAIFSKNGGSMAEPGAVSWQFERKGVVTVPHDAKVDEDDLMLGGADAGRRRRAGQRRQLGGPDPAGDLGAVRSPSRPTGGRSSSAELTMQPSQSVPIDSEGDARKVLRLIDLLDEHDDVQNVYANFDIPDSVMELVEV
jgi:YebC/PmpR family DNA-binding regulatory protein